MMPCGHAVVGGVDRVEAVLAERGDGGAHLLARDLGAPLTGLLVDDLLDLLVQDGVGALLEHGGVGVRLLAVDHHDAGVGGLVAQRLDDALALELADLLVVERDVGGDVALGEAVVRDDLHALLLGAVDPGLGGAGVDGVQDDHLDAGRDQVVELLLLRRDVLGGVLVVDLAVVAEFLDLRLDQRVVEGLVAGGAALGQEQADGLVVGLVLLAASCLTARGEGHRHGESGGGGRGPAQLGVHLSNLPDMAAPMRPRWLEVNSAHRAASRSKSLTR